MSNFGTRRGFFPIIAGIGARHAECCVYAHGNSAYLLGVRFNRVLPGIPVRRGAPGATHGDASGVGLRSGRDARNEGQFAECEDGVPIC